MCSDELETAEHLFLHCNVAHSLWRESIWPLNVSNLGSVSIQGLVKLLICLPGDLIRSPIDRRNFTMHAAFLLDSLWYARNSIIHRNQVLNVSYSLGFVRRRYFDHLLAWADLAFFETTTAPSVLPT